MTITVYSKPRCPQYNATYRILNKQGINYRSIDTTEDIDAFEYIKGFGYQQVLVVVASGPHWSSSRPDRTEAVVVAHLDSASLAVGQV